VNSSPGFFWPLSGQIYGLDGLRRLPSRLFLAAEEREEYNMQPDKRERKKGGGEEISGPSCAKTCRVPGVFLPILHSLLLFGGIPPPCLTLFIALFTSLCRVEEDSRRESPSKNSPSSSSASSKLERRMEPIKKPSVGGQYLFFTITLYNIAFASKAGLGWGRDPLSRFTATL